MRVTHTLSLKKNPYSLLRISIGMLYLWFGGLKFFPGASPAEALASQTIELLTFHLLPDAFIIPSLAVLEFIIGILLVFTREFKVTFWLLMFHMLCTLMPLFILPEITFNQIPFQLTIEGQYIIKNLVIISAALVLLQHYKTQTNS
mgnify:CR=1 FL=1